MAPIHTWKANPEKIFMPTITVEDIKNTLVEQNRLTPREAHDFLVTWFDELRAHITAGKQVTLAGLGTLHLSKRAYEVDTLDGPVKERMVKFFPNPALKARIQGSLRRAEDGER
jgi:hypothetical protein